MQRGRPTKMTREVIDKLEEIFALGGTDEEACLFSGISHETLYEYQRRNPAFVERKEALKETPMLKARRTIVESLGEPEHAKWYAERKRKTEFSQRTEMTGADGKDLFAPSQEEREAADKALKAILPE